MTDSQKKIITPPRKLFSAQLNFHVNIRDNSYMGFTFGKEKPKPYNVNSLATISTEYPIKPICYQSYNVLDNIKEVNSIHL